MKTSATIDVFFWLFAIASVVTGWLVFRTDSMVRAAYWLLASFVGVGVILMLLVAQFLGLVLILMMAGEMTIMAIFMVMFMMNPAGLNPMQMVHQHRASIVVGVAAFVGLAVAGISTVFPDDPVRDIGASNDITADLGVELLGDSMLIFQTAGVALLATMIGAIALTSHRGRFGDAHLDSDAPSFDDAAAQEYVLDADAIPAEEVHRH